MRPSINACGNLTKAPAIEKTSKGNSVLRFTIACNAGKDEEPTFLWCCAYKQKAETIAKFFEKGSPIVISGSLRQYTDDKKVAHFVCDVSDFGFVSGARRDAPPPPNEARDRAPQTSDSKEDDDNDQPF